LPVLRILERVHFQDIVELEHKEGQARRRSRRFGFWQGLVECTQGFSGDELRKLFNDAAMLAGAQDAQWLRRAHIEQALLSMIDAMPEERLRRYRQENYVALPRRRAPEQPAMTSQAQAAAQMSDEYEAYWGELPEGVFA
jgi:hypothetical protein